MFAQVQLLGHLGRNPDMSYTPAGVAVTKFSLAVTRKQKDKEDTTSWFNCVAFRNQAETIASYAGKGDLLFVQGMLDARQYTTKDGKPGTSLDVLVDKFAFTTSRKPATDAATEPPEEDVGIPEGEHPF